MPGRPPKPMAEHIRDGTVNSTRHKDRFDNVPVRGKPVKPPTVENDFHANQLWDAVVSHSAKGTIGAVDSASLEAMCVFWSDFQVLQQIHPLDLDEKMYARKEKACKMFMAIAIQFGLTPAARGRMKMIAVEKGEDDTRLTALMGMAGINN